MRFYQIATVGDRGQLHFNEEKLQGMVQTLYEGRYLVSFLRLDPKSTIKDYRACYFAKIDALALEVGEERYAIHHHIKEQILASMLEDTPELFTKQVVSTRYLDVSGWGNLLERLDLWAFIEYGIVLQ